MERMIDSLTYVTSNPGKAELLSHFLHFPVLHKTIDLIEIQSLDAAVTHGINWPPKTAYLGR